MLSSGEVNRCVTGFVWSLAIFVGALLLGSYVLGATCGFPR